jgi:hypothetical protein
MHRSFTRPGAGAPRLDAGLALRLSAFGLAAELAIALTTVLPNAPVVPQWPVFLLFPGIFVVHLRSVRVLSRRRGRRLNVRELLRGVPLVLRAAFVALFLLAWVVGLASILHIGGQPREIQGRYFLDDHGALIPATHGEYLHALVLQQRIFTLIPAVFYALGIIVNWPARMDPASQMETGWSTVVPAAPGLAGPASADRHGSGKNTAPLDTNAASAFGAPRHRLGKASIASVLVVLLLARLLLLALSSSSVRAWLHVGSRLPSCEAAGISTPQAREGECARGSGLFSPATVYNVVDRGHTLAMPEYRARLLSSRIVHTRVTGPATNAAYYPAGHGLLVSYELTIANPGGEPLPFGQDTGANPLPFYPKHPRAELAIPTVPDSDDDVAFGEILNGRGAPRPSIARQPSIPAHGSITGWVTFVAPGWSGELLGARAADLNFLRIDNDAHYVGQIRLWK